jgi:Protein of unknown function (DUF2910).
MGPAIGQVLGNAVGVAISPIPVIAVILMLFSRSATRNSLAFLAGWLVGLTGIAIVVLAIGLEPSSDGESTIAGLVKIAIGALFLVLAAKQWTSRPQPGDEPELPAWMAAIDDLGALKALALGLVLTVPNPKNLGLTVAASLSVSQSDLARGEQVITVAVFVLIASVTILVPVIGNLVAGARAEPVLTRMKEWLMANNNTVMTVLFLVLGVKVIGDGISLVS